MTIFKNTLKTNSLTLHLIKNGQPTLKTTQPLQQVSTVPFLKLLLLKKLRNKTVTVNLLNGVFKVEKTQTLSIGPFNLTMGTFGQIKS